MLEPTSDARLSSSFALSLMTTPPSGSSSSSPSKLGCLPLCVFLQAALAVVVLAPVPSVTTVVNSSWCRTDPVPPCAPAELEPVGALDDDSGVVAAGRRGVVVPCSAVYPALNSDSSSLSLCSTCASRVRPRRRRPLAPPGLDPRRALSRCRASSPALSSASSLDDSAFRGVNHRSRVCSHAAPGSSAGSAIEACEGQKRRATASLGLLLTLDARNG